MDRGTELRLIAEIGDFLAQKTTAMAEAPLRRPASLFTDPGRLVREREALFRPVPLAVGSAAALARPGDFLTGDAAGRGYLVVRGDDGALRAFTNVCRHRANTLCQEPSGNRRAFTCEYHAWSYDRQGRCLTFNDPAAFSGLEKSEYDLFALPAEERHGLVWLVPEPGAAIDVAGHLGPGLDAELSGYDPFAARVFREVTRPQPFNWKFGIDTFCELFHLSYLHRESLRDVFIGNVSSFEPFGRHFRETVVRTTFPAMLELPEEERTIFPHTAIVYYLFPNSILTWQLDHLEHWQFFPSPGDDDACIVKVSLLVDREPQSEAAVRHWERNWDALERTVFGEDFGAMARIQANLRAGSVDHLVYGRNELGLQHFHTVIDEAVGAQAG